MNLVCSTLPFKDRPVQEALKKMAILGVKEVELCVDPRHSDPCKWKVSRAEVLEVCHRYEISVHSIHVPEVQEEAKLTEEELAKTWTETSMGAIDLASSFRAGFIVQHVRRIKHTSGESGDEISLTLPELNRVVEYADQKGIRIAIENVPSSPVPMLGSSFHELLDVIRGFGKERVGICLDIAHSCEVGVGPREALASIGMDHLMSVHASDSRFRKGEHQHLPIGKGEVDWEEFLGILYRSDFKGSYVVEVSGQDDGGKALNESLAYLQQCRFADVLGVRSDLGKKGR